MDDLYGHGNLLKFAVSNNLQALIQPHHEADDGFHLDLIAPEVIGHEFEAASGIIHVNVGGCSMLSVQSTRDWSSNRTLMRHLLFVTQCLHYWYWCEFAWWP